MTTTAGDGMSLKGERGTGEGERGCFWCFGAGGASEVSFGQRCFSLRREGGTREEEKTAGEKESPFFLSFFFSLFGIVRERYREEAKHTLLSPWMQSSWKEVESFSKREREGERESGVERETKKKKKCDFGFSFSFFFDSHLFTLSLLLSPPLLHSPSSTRNSSPSLSPRITAATSRTLAPLRWSATTPLEKL